jgi:transglutaminase-like putative cysteine protease
MIYRIEHRTRYLYAAPVAIARCLLRLTPRTGGDQIVAAARLTIEPGARRREDDIDFFGNVVSRVELSAPDRKLELTSTVLIRVERAEAPMPELTLTWEAVRDSAWSSASPAPDAPCHMLFASPHAPISGTLTAYARTSFRAGRPVLDGALELATRIKAEFAYDPAATEVSTPVETAFAARRGVCQDFAHLMISGLRGLGLPARYVSGYLRTVPPPGKQRLVGADATHAWVDVWAGAGTGWIGLDPTNGVAVGNDHVVLAVGRDYSDVAPVAGVILAAGDHRLEVAVDMVELGERDAVAALAS